MENLVMGDGFVVNGCTILIILSVVSLMIIVNRRKVAGQTFTDALGEMLEPVARPTRCPRCSKLRVIGMGHCLGCGKIVFRWRFWSHLLFLNALSVLIIWIMLSDPKPKITTKINMLLAIALLSFGPLMLTMMAKVRPAPK